MEAFFEKLKENKRWIIWGAIGFTLLFFILSFLASYYEYKTKGPLSEEHASLYDAASFKRLREQLTKDKPEGAAQKELLARIVSDTEDVKRASSRGARTGDDVYSQGTFDTLAVNCGILVEKYKELVIKYHELEKRVGATKPKRKSTRSKTTPRLAKKSSGSKGFDYTRYVRSSSSNELLNDGSRTPTAVQFTWATLSLTQRQKIFDQSIVSLDVAEAFALDGLVVPHGARVEGVAQVSRGRGRIYVNFTKLYTFEQTLAIEGEAFSLDRSRGLNVFIQGESGMAQGLKREATDLVGLIDPSRSGIGRSVIQDTDVGREVFGVLDAGTMILANIRKR